MKGQTIILGSVLGAAVLCASLPTRAVELTASAELATAHLFRGQTRNDAWVLQPGVMMSGFPIAIETGLWGNLDLSDAPPTSDAGQFSRLDLFLNYTLPSLGSNGPTPAIGYREYLSPLSSAPADRELRLGLMQESLLTATLDVHRGLDGAIEKDTYVEMTLGRIFTLPPLLVDLHGGISYRDRQDTATRGLSHAWLTMALRLPVLSASVTVLHRLDSDVLPDDAYDVRVLGRLGAHMTF